MHNHYLTLARPFRDLFVWLRQYLEIYPPPGFPHVRVTGEPLLLHEDEVTRSLGVQFHGRQGDRADVLLFEVVAQEAHGACSLRLRCHEPGIAPWFWTLLERLAPARASGQVQPLPPLPTPPAGQPERVDDAPPLTPNRQSQEAPSTAAQDAPAPAAQEAPAPAGRLRPGRKGFTPEEIEKLNRAWINRPPGMTVEAFCRRYPIGETTFRKYVPDRWRPSW